MRTTELLHDLFANACQTIDSRITKVLFESAEALTHCKQLSIASLGRTLNRAAKVKHNIKCIDRLFGNKTFHSKQLLFYQVMAQKLIKNNTRPVIIIDWSGLTPCGAYYFLRAAIATLKKIIPTNCKPIVITDAGFRNPWFRLIKGLGWDFIGRVRHKTQFKKEHQSLWFPIKDLYLKTSYKAHYVGRVLLSKCNSIECYFYLKIQEKKHRVKRNLAGKKIQCSVSKKHEAREKEPWLLASSLSPNEMRENEIILLYKKRMQIEEAFRDLKNIRNGFGLRHCRSFSAERLNVALLIASLATFFLWILGTAAKKCNLHYSFQSNTERGRNVLSNFIIGWQMLLRNDIKLTKKEIKSALNDVFLSTYGEFI